MKKIILFMTLFLLLYSSTFVIAQNIEVTNIGTNSASGRPMYQYDFTIYKGWNLVPPLFYSAGDRGCGIGPDNQHLLYAFVWTPTKGYVGGKLKEYHYFDLSQFDIEEQNYLSRIMQGGTVLLHGESGGEKYEPYISTAAMWVYSDKDCKLEAPEGDNPFKLEIYSRSNTPINVQQNVDKDLSYIMLQKGWNIITVLPTMFNGDKLSDYFGRCSIEKFAVWNSARQEWNFPIGETAEDNQIISLPLELDIQNIEDDIITPESYYQTFVIKVSDECNLGKVAEEPERLCNKVLDNGNPNNFVDIVFIPDDYSNLSLWQSDVETYTDTFFSVEPMESNKNKFNVWRIDQMNTEFIEDVGYVQLTSEKKQLAKQIARSCVGENSDMTFLIKDNSDNPEEGYGFALYDDSMVTQGRITIDNGEEVFASATLVHEFGHAFVNLGDEYQNSLYVFYDFNRPNLDMEGCPKWCSGELNQNAECYPQYIQFRDCLYNLTNNLQNPEIYQSAYNPPYIPCSPHPDSAECDLGIDCRGGTGCYWNGHALTSFMSSPNSIMSSIKIEDGFNIISQEAITNKINNIVGGSQ